MKNKLLLLFFIAALGFLFWKGYPIIKDRYFEQNNDSTPAPEIKTDIGSPMTEEELPPEPEPANDEKQETLKDEGKIQQKVTRQNCDSECAGFSGSNLEYCQEVCGLKPVQENPAGCEAKSGIQKDYCLKNQAISEKSFDICDRIKDENVKQTCKNRIIEDLFNGNTEPLPD